VNGSVTFFVWDGWNLIEERNAGGAVVESYTHGAGVDELLCKTNLSGTVYYHHDGLGSVTALSDGAGLIVEKCRYDVFGSAALTDAANLPRANSAYGNRYLFTGREWISEAGLYDYRNRFYAAEIGRFLQNDPIRFLAGDVNLYRYVENSVAILTDPEGKWPTAAAYKVMGDAGIGATAGVLSEAAQQVTSGDVQRNNGFDGGKLGSAAAGGALGGIVGGAIGSALGGPVGEALGAALGGAILGGALEGLLNNPDPFGKGYGCN
jgi:RHS repeat-associated protein